MELMLLRHGDAEALVRPDDARPLTPWGRECVQRQARYLTQAEPAFDLMVCSPLVRARQSLEIVADILPQVPQKESSLLVPEADVQLTTKWLSSLNAERVLLVSHMPFLSILTSWLIDGHMQGRHLISTAGLVKLRMSEGIAPGLAELLYLRNP